MGTGHGNGSPDINLRYLQGRLSRRWYPLLEATEATIYSGCLTERWIAITSWRASLVTVEWSELRV